MTENYKITKKHFRYFKKRVYFWQKVLGGAAFIIFCHQSKISNKATHARYIKSDDTATINIYLNTKVSRIKPTKEELDNTAFHEVFESVYLGTLRSLAKSSWSEYEVEQATHKTVMMATNMLYKKMRGY